MQKMKVGNKFTAEHQALLFAWIVKAAIDAVGEEKAALVVKKAVTRYGEQRGHRMAMRAQNNVHPLTMLNYVAYGEWKTGKNEMHMEYMERSPNLRVLVSKCSWYTAWENKDLTKYGRYYCLYIDQSVVRGFNPDLKLDIGDLKPDGKAACDMVFHGLRLGMKELFVIAMRKLFKPGNKAIMPWDYHTGHIYKTMREVFIEELGEDGSKIINDAMAEFIKFYGEELAHIVYSFQNIDFNTLPDKNLKCN